MKNSHDSYLPITEEDVQYILEDNFSTEWRKATCGLFCKNCGKKSRMTTEPKFFLNAKNNIIIDGFCSDCNQPLLSKIKTAQRIDWNEYAMVVRDARVFFAAYHKGSYTSDKQVNIPSSSKCYNEQPREHQELITLP